MEMNGFASPRSLAWSWAAAAIMLAITARPSAGAHAAVMGAGSASTVYRPGAAHGNLQACSILTLRVVSAVFGKGVLPSRHASMGAFNTCDYSTKRGFLDFLITTTSQIRAREPRTHDAATMYSLVRSTAPGETRPVSKLGDKAFWAPSLDQLWVLKGDVLFNVSQFTPGSQTLVLLTRAAQRALHRL
jgi:hypothetical protein